MSLELKDVRFAYRDRLILDGISLSIEQGETVVVLGGNGSGKSTLLHVAAGLITPQSGSVVVNGSRPEDTGYAGIVFQNPDTQMLAPTVEEEIALGLELRGRPPSEIRRRVDDVIEQFQLQELLHRAPETLSGGQKQRVALASVMVFEPNYLLLDEPVSLLDARSRRGFLEALERVRGQCGMLWTVADPTELPVADRYCVLDGGRLTSASAASLREKNEGEAARVRA